MNIIVLGPQGSGKGTQAELLSKHFQAEHIDMGAFLREVAKQNTPIGREIYEIQNVSRTLVPSRILREVFTLKLNSLPREQSIVFDGFPRNIDQANYFEEILGEFGRRITRLIFVNISAEESFKRISKRWVCGHCGNILIMGKDIDSENDKCPKCSGKIIQRTDDTKEGIEKRLRVYQEETMPVIGYFQEKGLVYEVDGEQEIEKVFKDILENLKNID